MNRTPVLSSIRNTLVSLSLSIVLFKLSSEMKNGFLLKIGAILMLIFALFANIYFNYYIYMEEKTDDLIKTHIVHYMSFLILISLIVLFYFISV